MSQNPYESPTGYVPEQVNTSESLAGSLPGFVKSWMITELVFAVVRTLYVALTIISVINAAQEEVNFSQAIPDIIVSIFLAVLGFATPICVFKKNQIALRLSRIFIAVTIFSYFVYCFNLSLTIQMLPNENARNFMMGIAVAIMVIRIVFLNVFLRAMKRYQFFMEQSQ